MQDIKRSIRRELAPLEKRPSFSVVGTTKDESFLTGFARRLTVVNAPHDFSNTSFCINRNDSANSPLKGI